jgi:hypothetical protein
MTGDKKGSATSPQRGNSRREFLASSIAATTAATIVPHSLLADDDGKSRVQQAPESRKLFKEGSAS